MHVPSFDELDADQLKDLIQTSKKPAKNSKKLPLQEEKDVTLPAGEALVSGMKVLDVNLSDFQL